MGRPCSTNGKKRNAYRLLVGKPEGKRPLGRPRRRWVDNIKMDLGEVGWGDVNWIGLAQDRNRWRAVVNSVLNLLVLWNAGKLSSGLTSSGLSSSVQLHRVIFLPLSVASCCASIQLVPYDAVNRYKVSIRKLPFLFSFSLTTCFGP
jgi:hypothetical protein